MFILQNTLFIKLIYLFFNDSFGERIKGRVIDQESGEPLFNVNIYLSGTLWGTTSDENGYFVLEDLTIGTYNFKVSFLGYNSYSLKLTYINI